MLKIWQKMSFSKTLKSTYKSFIAQKQMSQCLMSAFVDLLFIGLISDWFTCSHDRLKIKLYKQILQFQHQLKLQLWNMEKHVIMTAPFVSFYWC
jgi:hypothetical protein